MHTPDRSRNFRSVLATDTWQLLALFAGASILAPLVACGSDEVIGDRSDPDADAGMDDQGDDGDGDNQTPARDGGSEVVDGSDGGVTDAGPDSGATEGELPACDRGYLHGENSCEVCCIVDGDILEWCQPQECTACEQDGLVIEPGATASYTCNQCTCNRDGSIACTERDCDVDCEANPAACPWRSGEAYDLYYDRGDGYSFLDNFISGPHVNTPSHDSIHLDEAQRAEYYELLRDPNLRDFVRNGTSNCPSIDGYWSQLRSQRPEIAIGGEVSLTLPSEEGPGTRIYTRMLSADCQVEALAPLSAFIDRVAGR